MRQANFYNIALEVTTNYNDFGFVTGESEDFKERIKNYLNAYKHIQFGDVIFVGSLIEGKQYYGFKMVLDDGNVLGSEYGPNLPLENKYYYNQILERGVKYDGILEYFSIKNQYESNLSMYLFENWYALDWCNRDEEYEKMFQDIQRVYKKKGLLQ